uniref:Uncharacterized protein n=1 Tax=Panagrolaimus sp. PS1159 TaxID=55785 RepID=A0AC35FRG4_9BILA
MKSSREQGTLYRYNLPTVTLQYRTPLGYTAEKLSLNCSSTRLAVISTNNIFKLFDIRENGTQVVSGFEKKDIWDMKWDNDKEDTIAIMEKSRLLVVQGTTAADPVPNQGYICSFRDLTTLRKAKELLDAGKISEANVFIEQNSHPMLWKLLAKMAMTKLDFRMAEHAFVKLRDYLGICFLKRLESIQNLLYILLKS